MNSDDQRKFAEAMERMSQAIKTLNHNSTTVANAMDGFKEAFIVHNVNTDTRHNEIVRQFERLYKITIITLVIVAAAAGIPGIKGIIGL